MNVDEITAIAELIGGLGFSVVFLYLLIKEQNSHIETRNRYGAEMFELLKGRLREADSPATPPSTKKD